MCETHRALSSSSARSADVPQVPKAARMAPPISAGGSFSPNLPGDVSGRVERALPKPPRRKAERPKAAAPKPAPRRAPAPQTPVSRELAGEAVDGWARTQIRAEAQKNTIGVSKGEVKRIAKAVTDVVGTHAVISEVQTQARAVIARSLGDIMKRQAAADEQRKAAAAQPKAAPKVHAPRKTGSVHASNRAGGTTVETRGGKKVYQPRPGTSGSGSRPKTRPQYGQYARRPITIEEAPKPQVTDAEMQRRIKALQAAQAAEKAKKDGEE